MPCRHTPAMGQMRGTGRWLTHAERRSSAMALSILASSSSKLTAAAASRCTGCWLSRKSLRQRQQDSDGTQAAIAPWGS